MTYFAEYTDTFGGEANYSWVRRLYVEADSPKSALRRARRHFGLAGVKGDITGNYGDEMHWTPRRACLVLMVRWDDTPPESRYEAPVI
jgi:hypothetical protein